MVSQVGKLDSGCDDDCSEVWVPIKEIYKALKSIYENSHNILLQVKKKKTAFHWPSSGKKKYTGTWVEKTLEHWVTWDLGL